MRDALKKRLDENYEAFIHSLQGKNVSELIAMAPQITAAQQLHEELLGACGDDDVEFLLRFDDPLELVLGSWESEITGYDHSEEMGHTLWRIREDGPYDFERQEAQPISRDEIAIEPDMDFSGREIVAYIEIWFDVGRRFQVYPNIDDSCDLYAKYDPVTQNLRGELCVTDGYDGTELWEDVAFTPSEREMIIGAMEETCKRDTGKSLREVWSEEHPAVNRNHQAKKKNGRCQHER